MGIWEAEAGGEDEARAVRNIPAEAEIYSPRGRTWKHKDDHRVAQCLLRERRLKSRRRRPNSKLLLGRLMVIDVR